MFKTPTKAQMKHSVMKLIGVHETDVCCGINKRLVNGVIQLQNSIELSTAKDYEELDKMKQKSIKFN